MKLKERLVKPVDQKAEKAVEEFVQNREQIAKGFNKAYQYEMKNTHFNAGQKGGWGSLEWTNKQQIVDNYVGPMEASHANNVEAKESFEQWVKER